MNAKDADLPIPKPFVRTGTLRFGATGQLMSLDGILPLTHVESDVIALANFPAMQYHHSSNSESL
jgi:hypothetical protein